MGFSTKTTGSNRPLDPDLARAEWFGLRDLRMVMDDLCARGLPAAADEFPWPVLTHDDTHIRHANPACLRWLGCPGDGALVDQPLGILCAPEDERSLLAAFGAGALGPPPSPHLQRFRNQQGQVLLGHVLARRHELDGVEQCFVLIAPSAEADRSFELLRLLGEAVDHLTDIVFITEAHAIDGVGRRVVFVNRAFTASSGYEPREVLGKTPSVTIGQGTDRRVLQRLEAALSETRPVREDLLKYGKDGSPYWVELQIIPIFDGAGEHTHWISIQRDISERKRMEARVLESARLAAAGQLSASLANELNSPLASVVSSLEWLADRLPGLLGAAAGGRAEPELDQVLEALADARESAARMAAVTSYLQLLGNGGAPNRQAHAIAPLLDRAVDEAERQLERRLEIERDYEPDLLVLADTARLSHALRLVLLNAGLASSDGKARISVRGSGAHVHVSIDDAGPGIAAELAGALAAPFDVRKPTGIGDSLALFVASRLVAELDGELLLVPQLRGTRIQLRLPRGV